MNKDFHLDPEVIRTGEAWKAARVEIFRVSQLASLSGDPHYDEQRTAADKAEFEAMLAFERACARAKVRRNGNSERMATSRFSIDIPGLARMVWCSLRYRGWRRERCLGWWVTDHQRGEEFVLSNDEKAMLDALSESMDAVIAEAKIPWLRSNRFWTPQRIDAAKDRVLAAISDNRHGDSIEWDFLRAMMPDDWRNWVGRIADES